MAAEPKSLDLVIFEMIPETGLARRDAIYRLVRAGYSQHQAEQAIYRLLFRRHVTQVGDSNRPILVRNTYRIVYDNIRPITGVNTLLAMHRNFTEENPDERHSSAAAD